MNKKRKIMTSMHFRKNLPKSIEEVRFNNTEIIVMHYAQPVAKLVKLSDEEISELKK